jgi:hypothetical protein
MALIYFVLTNAPSRSSMKALAWHLWILLSFIIKAFYVTLILPFVFSRVLAALVSLTFFGVEGLLPIHGIALPVI